MGIAALILIGFATRSKWWEPTQDWVRAAISSNRKVSSFESLEHGVNASDKDPHAHAGHDQGLGEGTSLALSAQAQGNIGLTPDSLQPVKLETFRRSITVPGIIVGRPGRTR